MKTIERMNSSDMAIALLNDPQFKIPKYPKVSKGFNFISLDNSLLVDGGTEKQLFKGKAVKSVLPYVISQCDGATPIDKILNSSTEFPAAHIFQALSLMYARGLLQEGYEEKEEIINHPLYKVYDRLVDGTRVNKNVEEALQKIQKKRIILNVSDSESNFVVKELSRQLRLSGLNVIIDSDLKNITKEDLVISIMQNTDELINWKSKANSYYGLEIPFIFMIFDGSNLHVGPYIEKYETICFQCYLNQIERLELNNEKTPEQMMLIGISLVVPNIVYLISDMHRPIITQNITESYDLKKLTKQSTMFTKVPNCEVCNPQHVSNTIHDTLVSQYESMVEFPSRKFLNLKDHQNHYKSSNLNLTKVYKDYFNSPRISLPDSYKLLSMHDENDEYYQIISKILLLTTGIKEIDGNRVKRWAPTGGNLGSVHVYFVNNNVKELKKSTYFYQAFKHELQEVTENNEEMHMALNKKHDTPVIGTLIFTGSLERLSTKYNSLSFRLANLDAGVAFAQSQIVAKSLGYELSKTVNYNAEAVARHLGINDIGEMVTIVADIRKVGENG